MKRMLVTDGSGFLGSHPCDRLLTDGYEVNVDKYSDSTLRMLSYDRLKCVSASALTRPSK